MIDEDLNVESKQEEELSSSRGRKKKTTLFDLNALSDGSRDGLLQLAPSHANLIFLGASQLALDADNNQEIYHTPDDEYHTISRNALQASASVDSIWTYSFMCAMGSTSESAAEKRVTPRDMTQVPVRYSRNE